MTIVYIGLASIVLSLLLLWALAKFTLGNQARAEKIDVASALRELLLAKAEGRIDQVEFERQQATLHAAILDPAQSRSGALSRLPLPWILGALGLVAVLILGIYWQSSHSGDVTKSPAIEDLAKLPGIDGNAKANTGGDLNTVVKRLADKMAKDPNNGEGWLLLAKTYGELRKHPEAAAAYEKAAALLPAEASMLADWADAYVMSHDRQWDDESRKIVKRALAVDPKHIKALALAGSEAYDRAAYKEAIALWKRMKAVAPADSMDSKLADANIVEATARLSGKTTPTEPVADVAPGISGKLTISAKLRAKVGADDTVFIVARTPDESGPPLAVKRYKGADLPIDFQLDDSAAIVPGRSISQFPEVLITAKVSKLGQAEQRPGDIYAAPVKVRSGASKVQIELSQEK